MRADGKISNGWTIVPPLVRNRISSLQISTKRCKLPTAKNVVLCITSLDRVLLLSQSIAFYTYASFFSGVM
jgi:hypothetical protein